MKDKSRHIFMLRRVEMKRSSGLIRRSLQSNYGFSSRELNELGRLVEENEAVFLETWNEYFGQH